MAEFIVQGFILKDTNNDGIIEEVHVDYQKVNGKAGTIMIPSDTAVVNFMQKVFNAVKAQL